MKINSVRSHDEVRDNQIIVNTQETPLSSKGPNHCSRSMNALIKQFIAVTWGLPYLIIEKCLASFISKLGLIEK